MGKIKVGYLQDSYLYQRNITGIVENAEYVKVNDFFRLMNFGVKALKRLKIHKNVNLIADLSHSFNDLNLNKIDLLHFFNTISYGKTPWISTFETFVPKYTALTLASGGEKGFPVNNKKALKGLSAVSGNSCKKIIAMSNNALEFQRELLGKYPEFKETIENKSCVLHPPQRLFVDDASEKTENLNESISFVFVGREFFRKGGMEILRVFTKLHNQKKYPLKLTIISSLMTNDYATLADDRERRIAMDMIKQSSDWITHRDNLPNSEVLKLIGKHHVGLLPTWADTYGFSVLEMQALGCPVITTNIRALPEVNDDSRGWVIKVPKNRFGEAFYSTQEQRDSLSRTIEEQLEKIISDIFSDPEKIRSKAQKSIENIKQNHSLEQYSYKMNQIYTECI